MHAPATGLIVAEIVIDGCSKSLGDISALSIERFADGATLTAEANVI